jgi:cytochrome c biogenesis protein
MSTPEETAGKTKRSLTAIIWGFLSSSKLLIVLLLLLAVLSIAGTIIQQDRPLQEYYRYFKPLTVAIFNKLGLFDMYHSWWFVSCLVLLAVNLIACTITRYGGIIAGLIKRDFVLDERLKRSLPLVETITYDLSLKEVQDRALGIVGKKFTGKYRETVTEDGAKHFFFEKARYSRLSFFLTHLSILLIFLGGIIGSLFGYKGYVNLMEGDTLYQIQTRSGKIENLNFQVKCNSFDVEFYNTGEPKDYRSELSVIKDNREIIRKTIRVNDPLTFKGITFFQSSYGALPEKTTIEAVSKRDNSVIGNATALFGRRTAIHGIADIIEPADYQEHFILPTGMDAGPALGIHVYPQKGVPRGVWLLKDYPRYDRMRGEDYYFRIKDIAIREYTGLQVNKDPGEIMVWTGSVILILGVMIAFFISHRQLWVSLTTDENGKSELTIGATANRNRDGFGRETENIIRYLKEIV